MPAILKIGYHYFLVKSETQAISALKALSDAVLVEHGYDRKAGDIYYPAETDRHERAGIELKIISHKQLRRAKPGKEVEEEETREVKLLDFNGKVNYQTGGES